MRSIQSPTNSDEYLTLIGLQKYEDRFRAPKIVDTIFKKYFERLRRMGNRDPKFLDQMNETFICLVGAGLRYCLKACRTGQLDERSSDFKYETAWYRFIQLFYIHEY